MKLDENRFLSYIMMAGFVGLLLYFGWHLWACYGHLLGDLF